MRNSLACAAIALTLSACAVKKTAVVPTYGLAPDRSYIDIEPGWRLRVVTPLLKSGGYRPQLDTSPSAATTSPGTGLNVELRTNSDFLGYELAYYAFEPKGRIRLTSVEATVDGNTEPRTQPTAKLFDYPRDARYLRLVFLTRVSEADHDMAVLTAGRFEDLEGWTAKLRSDPEGTCKSTPYCSWIPGGIAVSAERRNPDTNAWIPADRAGRP